MVAAGSGCVVVWLQDNVALIAVLEMVEQQSGSKQLLCVANTHIHANPELNDVKLWQVHTLLKGLEKIANRLVGWLGAGAAGAWAGCRLSRLSGGGTPFRATMQACQSDMHVDDS